MITRVILVFLYVYFLYRINNLPDVEEVSRLRREMELLEEKERLKDEELDELIECRRKFIFHMKDALVMFFIDMAQPFILIFLSWKYPKVSYVSMSLLFLIVFITVARKKKYEFTNVPKTKISDILLKLRVSNFVMCVYYGYVICAIYFTS